MSKRPRAKTPTIRLTGQGRALTELRRSSAAGPHGRYRPGRGNTRRAAIEQSKRER